MTSLGGCLQTLLFFYSACLFQKVVDCNDPTKHPLKMLATDLLKKYGPVTVRPTWDHENTATIVIFELLIAQVVEFDERKQQVTLNGWMKQVWQDDFLRWDPESYQGIKTLMLNDDQIWFPDVNLYENIDPGFLHTSPLSITQVNSTGSVSWSTPVIIQSSCKVQVRYFPFDTQVCTLTFGSWSMDGSQLKMRVSSGQNRERVFYDNGVWSFDGIEGDSVKKKFSCCEFPFEFAEFNLTMTRFSDFYVYNVLIPCSMLCLVNLMVFWMPPQAGEKMAFVVSNLLAAILFQQLVGSIMPPLGDEVPVLSLFFLLQIMLSCLVIVGTTFVLRVYHNHERTNKPIPPWIYRLTSKYYGIKTPLHGWRSAGERHSNDLYMQNTGSVNTKATDLDDTHSHDEEPLKDDEVHITWQEVSIVLDRVLFILALCISVAITVFVSVAYHV